MGGVDNDREKVESSARKGSAGYVREAMSAQRA